MSQLPFNTYDVFAYLASGSVVVSAADYLFGAQWFLREDHSAIFTLVLVFEIYLMGHIIATFSAAIFETVVVGRFLGQPSTLLMSENQSKAAWLFPLYYRPLPQVTRERIQQRLQENSFSGQGEALFLHIFSKVNNIEPTKRRLDEFRNLYGFSRNVSFAFLMVSIMLFIGPSNEQVSAPLGWAILALFASISMFYRYLKFLRQFSYEAFFTYSEQSEPK
jgi:hypothetical protein